MADTNKQSGNGADWGKLSLGSSSVLGGLTAIQNASAANSHIADTSQQWGAINSMDTVGRGNYSSFDQLSSDYDSLRNMQPDLDYDTIRGGSTGERLGNTLSATMSGAAAGAQVGGVYGAIAGAAIGLGTSVVGWLDGHQKAKAEQSILQSQQNTAKEIAGLRMSAAADNLSTSNFNNAYANRAAEGGQLQRKTMNIRDFANAVLARRREADRTHSAGIVRTHCKGGTMIRIKR